MEFCGIYPLVIKHDSGKNPMNEGFNRKITCKWSINGKMVGSTSTNEGNLYVEPMEIGDSTKETHYGNSAFLVGGIPTHLKNMKVNWDDDIPSIWGKKKCSKPPTSYGEVGFQHR